MNVNLKRRWALAIGAVVLLLLLLLLGGALVQQPKDAPRPAVERCFSLNGRPVVSLRLHAPRRRAMRVVLVGAKEVEPERDRQSVVWVRSDSQHLRVLQGLVPIVQMSSGQIPPSPLTVKAGTSLQYDVLWSASLELSSTTGMWRLAVLSEVENRGIRGWNKRLGLCWKGRTLRPLLDRWAFADIALLLTEPITNAVPRTLDAPGR
jgi:hypothetical protein